MNYIAFDADRCIATGSLSDIAAAAFAASQSGSAGPLLAFHADTSEPVELDLRGSLTDVLQRVVEHRSETSATSPTPPASSPSSGDDLPTPPARVGPGRPKLGVVAREITLLPRHWQWLAEQPGGASVTLRKLVEEARGAGADRDRRRRAQNSTYRFLTAMLGDHAGYEEATRALFASDASRFAEHSSTWPHDLKTHAMRLADAAFAV